jgi:hypothetical protein
VSRLSYRMTYRPQSTSRWHKVSGQRTIEAVAPMINSNPGFGGVTEGLGAPIQPVGLDHPLASFLVDRGPP